MTKLLTYCTDYQIDEKLSCTKISFTSFGIKAIKWMVVIFMKLKIFHFPS